MNAAVTLSDGTILTPEMSPMDRHNAVARSVGAATVERPAQESQFHTPATMQRFAQLDAEAERASGTAPASPGTASAPASNLLEGSAALAAIEAMSAGMDESTRRITAGVTQAAMREVMDKGARVERLPDGSIRTLLPGEEPTPQEVSASKQAPTAIDEQLLERLNQVYMSLPPAERIAKRQVYEKDLARIYGGLRSGESVREFEMRIAANRDTPRAEVHTSRIGVTLRDEMRGQEAIDALQAEWRSLSAAEQAANGPDFRLMLQDAQNGAIIRRDPNTGEFESFDPEAPSGSSAYTPAEWEAGHASVTDADGYIPLERINPEGMSGYTLPRLIPDQTYSRNVFAELAAARAAGVTQDQVNAFIEAQMRRDGFIQ